MHLTSHLKQQSRFKNTLLAGCAVLAMGTTPLLAQDSTTSAPSTQEATLKSAKFDYRLEVGAIDAVESNVDAETIRKIVTGDIKENAQALATLNAKTILIPEVKLTYTVEVDGEATDNVFVFKNIVLSNVQNGVAQTASMEAVTGSVPPNKSADVDAPFTFKLDQSTITKLNLGALLNSYGFITPKSDEMALVYQDFVVAGGTLDAGPVKCDIGKYRAGEYRARAMKVSYPELMALAKEMEGSNKPDPAQIVTLLDFYADMLYAYETEPVTFDGITCAGEDKGTKFDFSLGTSTMGAMGNGIYPSLSANDIVIKIDGKQSGEIKLDNFTFKEIDFNPTIEAYEQIEDITALDEAWFKQNYRSFIPAFNGFAFSGFAADVPDEENGGRIDVKVDNFDVSLSDYVNGIPSQISLVATGAAADLPETSKDKGVQQLIAAGIKRLDAGYELTLGWDEASETIEVKRLMVTADQLGTLDVTGLLVGAAEELFASDPQTAMIAAMGLGIKEIDVNLDNKGFLDLALAQAAAEQGAPVDAFQTQISAMSQGMIVGFLGGVDQAVALGESVSGFLGGDAENLDISIRSKSESGVGMPQIMALQADPKQLLEIVDIEASAK
jgi:hypothetical protein